MNVEIVTEAPILLFWEYLFQIFAILSLQCTLVGIFVRLISNLPLCNEICLAYVSSC
jgi:hypothetical protein